MLRRRRSGENTAVLRFLDLAGSGRPVVFILGFGAMGLS